MLLRLMQPSKIFENSENLTRSLISYFLNMQFNVYKFNNAVVVIMQFSAV